MNNRFVQAQRNTATGDGECEIEDLPEAVEGSDE
jgi:hypothetical protein